MSTGNSLDFVDRDMEIMLENMTAVKEMEANAIAWVASMFGTPLMALKAVTDIVDGDRPTGEEFLENLGKTVAALTVRTWLPGSQIGVCIRAVCIDMGTNCKTDGACKMCASRQLSMCYSPGLLRMLPEKKLS